MERFGTSENDPITQPIDEIGRVGDIAPSTERDQVVEELRAANYAWFSSHEKLLATTDEMTQKELTRREAAYRLATLRRDELGDQLGRMASRRHRAA